MVVLSFVLSLLVLSPSQALLSHLRPHGDASLARASHDARGPASHFSAAGRFAPRPKSSPASVPDGAGGHYVLWSEVRNGDADIFLLRVTSAGTPASGWPASGVVVCNAGGEQAEGALWPDGAGGVIAGWLDARDGLLAIAAYGQRFNASGVPQWTANGVKVLTWDATIGEVYAAPDGSGGLYLVWEQSNADVDIYGVHYDNLGGLVGGWSTTGTVICDATGDQYYPALAADGSGGAVVVWSDDRGAATHAFAQRMTGGGAPLWTANGVQVDASTLGIWDPTVCSAAGGHSLVFWGDNDGDAPVLGQRLNGSGVAQWTAGGVELHPGTGVGAPDGDFLAIPDGSDGAIVAWITYDFIIYGIHTQRVNGSGAVQWGASGASIITSLFSYPDAVDVSADASGGAFFAWTDYRSGVDLDIYAARVTSGGSVPWTAGGEAVCTAGGRQGNPSITPDGSGGALVSWLDERGFDTDVYSQQLDASGVPQLAADGIATYSNPGVQTFPATVQTADGGALIAWSEKRNGEYDIRARKLNADGTPAGPVSMLCDIAGNQILSGMIEDGAGGAIVVWTEGVDNSSNIIAQRIDGSATPLWAANGAEVCTATGPQYAPDMVSDGAGGAIFTWYDARMGSFDANVYAQRLNAVGTALWAANGVAVCTEFNPQGPPRLAPDGAGGAILAWPDYRSGQPKVYAQRINGAGTAQWTANGVQIADYTGSFGAVLVSGVAPGTANDAVVLIHQRVPDLVTFNVTSVLNVQKVDGSGAPQWGATGTLVCDATSNFAYERLVADGSGGAYAAWSDDRNSPFDIYAQHVDNAGSAQWTANGNVVCNAAGWQNLGGVTRSGSDLFFTWADNRSGDYDIYAHRMNSSGADVWAADGVIVSNEVNGQFYAGIAPWRTATPERLFVAWADNRIGTQREVYAERLDFSGVSQWTPDGVTATTIALASAEADRERVRLVWYGSEEVTATVYRRTETGDWSAVGTALSDGSRRITFEDRDIEPGMRYGYRLGIIEDGTERFLGEAWVEVPSDLELALFGLSPNPAVGDLLVVFTLPRSGQAKLELLDLSGRRVREDTFTGLAAGRHTLKLEGQRPAPGVYFLRLTQGQESVTTRAAVMR